MKKKFNSLFSLILFLFCIGCAGYEPIFKSSNLQFKVSNYLLGGDKKLSYQVYSKIKNLSKANENSPKAKRLDFAIKTTKNKEATVKNSSGKILEYKITLNTNITIKDFSKNEEIFSQKFIYFSSYKVQDQHSESVKAENQIIENLLNTTYENLLIKMTENIFNL